MSEVTNYPDWPGGDKVLRRKKLMYEDKPVRGNKDDLRLCCQLKSAGHQNWNGEFENYSTTVHILVIKLIF